MSNNKIFVALSTFAEHDQVPMELLESSGFPYKIHRSGKRITTDELLRDGVDATVIVAGVEPYSAEILSKLPQLRCISRCGVGVDSIDLAAAKAREIAVVSTPNAPIRGVAELALAMFLALSRNLRSQAGLMQARRWERVTSHLLGTRTIGIVGFGRIGKRVAELCIAFGARVIAHDPAGDDAFARQVGVELVGFDRLLAESDIVSLHASKSAGQPFRIGAAELSVMKRGSIVVNLARGDMVDDLALAIALESGHIVGAGLDVFAEEPYKGPLCDFEQVILTPHSSTMPVETRAEMELGCISNGIRFLRGELKPGERVA